MYQVLKIEMNIACQLTVNFLQILTDELSANLMHDTLSNYHLHKHNLLAMVITITFDATHSKPIKVNSARYLQRSFSATVKFYKIE